MRGDHWHGMPVVLSGGEGRQERLIVMSENVRSLTVADWCIIQMQTLGVFALGLIEV